MAVLAGGCGAATKDSGPPGRGATSTTNHAQWADAGGSGRECVSPAGSSTPYNTLNGVAAASPTAAWAVGQAATGQALIERWNGRAWKQVAAPNRGGRYCGVLNAITISGPADAWAVGDYSNGTVVEALIEHWNGRAWSQVPSPSPGGSHGNSTLTGVAANGPSSAWAVGSIQHVTPRARAMQRTGTTACRRHLRRKRHNHAACSRTTARCRSSYLTVFVWIAKATPPGAIATESMSPRPRHGSECRRRQPSLRSGASARRISSSERAPTRLRRASTSQWRA